MCSLQNELFVRNKYICNVQLSVQDYIMFTKIYFTIHTFMINYFSKKYCFINSNLIILKKKIILSSALHFIKDFFLSNNKKNLLMTKKCFSTFTKNLNL